MKNVYFFLVFFLLISCEERNQNITFQTPKFKTTTVGEIIAIDSTQIAAIKDSLVTAFYKTNNNKTYWIGDSIRKKTLSLLNNVEEEGLFVKDFDLKKLNSLEKKINSLPDTALVSFDILLTQNLSFFIQKLSKGNLQPKNLYQNWDLKENNIDTKSLLLNFQKKDSFDFAVKEIAPKHLVYTRLKEALRIVNSFPKEDFRKIEIESKLVLTDTNAILEVIKKKLIYWKDLETLDSLTPIFDKDTELAVKKFQIRHGLTPDGVIGKETVEALNISKKQRKEQIIANMERWRWYPRKFENRYLIINIPDYSLFVMNEKDTIKACKVIVGKFKRQTPILSSKLAYLVLNPTWTVPPTILENDIIPSIIRDSTYLTRKNISVYDIDNKIINLVDWDVNQAENYRYVQSLGVGNTLGLVKFIFSNRFTIYLHDTNAKSLFNYDLRAFSSGCIRVQNPLKLTEYLLDDAKKWNSKKINDIIKEGESEKVKIKKDIYIHILYWTAWSKNTSLQFRKDLYNLDADLYQKLSN